MTEKFYRPERLRMGVLNSEFEDQLGRYGWRGGVRRCAMSTLG